jgi:hypothetical protein
LFNRHAACKPAKPAPTIITSVPSEEAIATYLDLRKGATNDGKEYGFFRSSILFVNQFKIRLLAATISRHATYHIPYTGAFLVMSSYKVDS